MPYCILTSRVRIQRRIAEKAIAGAGGQKNEGDRCDKDMRSLELVLHFLFTLNASNIGEGNVIED